MTKMVESTNAIAATASRNWRSATSFGVVQ